MKADHRCGCVWWIRKRDTGSRRRSGCLFSLPLFTRTTSQSLCLRKTLATVTITRGNSRSVFSLVIIGEFMNKRNYQKELEKKLEELQSGGGVPTLFLHSCCAPCSSYVLEYLSRYFEITVFYYNPNIYPPSEYEERTSEQERLIREFNGEWENEADRHPIHFVAGTYVPDDFYAAAKGLEQEPEGGARCTECFKLRLSEAAREAKAGGFDFFTTTLTISPLKDAERLNRIGEEMGKEYGVEFLPSDFKKKNGYKRSTELSREHALYRQNYCGCVFSKREAEERTGRSE